MRRVVVLPAPLGPRNPVIVPGSSANDRLSTAVSLPNRFVSDSARTTGAMRRLAASAGRCLAPAGARHRALRYSNFASTCLTMV